MKWQVGQLRDFRPDDPEFDDKNMAFDAATDLSEANEDDVIGVWTDQDDGSELIAIAYQGELFRRELKDFGVHITLPGIVRPKIELTMEMTEAARKAWNEGWRPNIQVVTHQDMTNTLSLINPDGSDALTITNIGEDDPDEST